MLGEKDIYRTTNMLIEMHGEDTATETAMKHGSCLEKGDLAGCDVWKRIILDEHHSKSDRH